MEWLKNKIKVLPLHYLGIHRNEVTILGRVSNILMWLREIDDGGKV